MDSPSSKTITVINFSGHLNISKATLTPHCHFSGQVRILSSGGFVDDDDDDDFVDDDDYLPRAEKPDGTPIQFTTLSVQLNCIIK